MRSSTLQLQSSLTFRHVSRPTRKEVEIQIHVVQASNFRTGEAVPLGLDHLGGSVVERALLTVEDMRGAVHNLVSHAVPEAGKLEETLAARAVGLLGQLFENRRRIGLRSTECVLTRPDVAQN